MHHCVAVFGMIIQNKINIVSFSKAIAVYGGKGLHAQRVSLSEVGRGGAS